MIRSRQLCDSYSATGTSSARAPESRPSTVTLTSAHIARLTGDPERTVRHRLMRWHEQGGPVARVARPGGGWRYSVTLEDYAARVARDPDELRVELAGLAEAA